MTISPPAPAAPSPFAAPRSRQAVLDGAKAALASGDPARALALLAVPLGRTPNDPAMLSFAGLAHKAVGDAISAVALLERAVKLAPTLAPARLALAEALIEAHRAPAALAMLDALPSRLQRAPGALLARAAALSEVGDEPGAIKALRTLARLDPRAVPVRLRLGHALRALGQTEAALAEYRRAIDLEPASGAAWWSIANVDAARLDDADLAALRATLGGDGLSQDDRVRILFALARAEEVRGHDAASFALYEQANALRYRRTAHDRERFRVEVEASAAVFTSEFFAARRDHGCRSAAPIFIVGMQRSGSTLLEQMLASHLAVEGTSELPHLNQMVREAQRQARLTGRTFAQWLAELDAGAARALGEDYLARAAPHRHAQRPRFIDKTPNNWAHVGFIRLILPEARIIDVRRDPMACGWSNFRQLYASGLEHSYALADWAHHYRTYAALMDAAGAVPGAPLRIDYEALVRDPEAELRRACRFLDIAFDPAMLAFHANRRAVRTISAEQVRRPLDPGALDQWRRFEQWLGPLRDALER